MVEIISWLNGFLTYIELSVSCLWRTEIGGRVPTIQTNVFPGTVIVLLCRILYYIAICHVYVN